MLNSIRRKKLAWILVFIVIVNHFLLSGSPCRTPSLRIHFDVVLKCLSACVWFQNFIWDMLNSRWKEKLGLNICFLFTVSQFLISSCPWTAFLRIRLNLWCSFKVSVRQRRLLIRGCSLGNLLVWKAAIWECFKWRCFCSHRPRKTAQ